MSGPSPVRVFFGRALMAVGGLSGLCTAIFLPIFVFGPQMGEFNGAWMPLLIGGPLIGPGGAAFLVGRALAGARLSVWRGWTAVGVGGASPGLILAAAGVFERRRRGPPGPQPDVFS